MAIRSCDGTGHRTAGWHGQASGYLLLVLIALPINGCDLGGHQTEKAQAQRNWNEVRAKVKCQLARQQFNAGAFDDAIKSAEEAMRLNPADPAPFVVAAQSYIEKSDWSAATRVIDVGESIEVRAALEHKRPSAVDRRTSAPPDATAAAEGWAELLYLRGVIAERMGDLAAAIEAYRRVRLLVPTEVDYLVGEVECLVAAGRVDEANELLAATGGSYRRDGTIEVLSAQIALLRGDEAAAAAHLDAAMNLVDDDQALAGRYGALLARVGRHAEAVSVLRPLVERPDATPSSAMVRGLAASLFALGRYDDVKALLLKRVAARPNEAWSWLLLARAAIALGDLPTTRRCAGEVRRLHPHDTETNLIEGYVNWKQGDLPAAERALAVTLSADPRDSLALCLMGEVLTQDGRVESACQHFRRALQIDPDCQWARVRLEQLDTRYRPAITKQKRMLGAVTDSPPREEAGEGP